MQHRLRGLVPVAATLLIWDHAHHAKPITKLDSPKPQQPELAKHTAPPTNNVNMYRTYSKRGSLSEFRRFYREGSMLGQGSFAIVKKAVELSTKESVAVKEIDKALSDEGSIENEVRVMERLGAQDNIVSLHAVFESPTTLYLVQDLAEGGELFDVIVKRGELSERMAAKYFLEAVRGVCHLHERHVVHLDIKPENLLLKMIDAPLSPPPSAPAPPTPPAKHAAATLQSKKKEERVVLADFGLAVYAGKGSQAGQLDFCVGTPAYWAPEMVRRESFGLGVDVWALGCVLYIMLCGIHPFDPTGEAPEAQILSKIVKGEYDTSNISFKALSPSAKDLIRHLLDVDPNTRYTARQILQHPWLVERDRNSEKRIGTRKLQGFRVLSLIKRGMPQLLAKAESDLFSIIDKDGDGFITRNELGDALELVGLSVSPQELDAFLKLADANGDGKVSREEFDTVLSAKFTGGGTQSSVQDLEQLFLAYDRDHDGYISVEDVDHVLSLLGTTVMKSAGRVELEAMVDLDGDGRVSFTEFVRFVRLTENEKQDSLVGGMTSSIMRLRDKRDMLKSRR